MMKLCSVIVLGAGSTNKKGDLFAASMQSLFASLGYQDFRLNIHKTGREIDIEGVHSREHRRLIAECKATASCTGGTDVNAFMGKVEVERAKDATPLQAYFVSLSGFTQSAIEQEKEAGRRVVLLDSSKVIESLVSGGVLIDSAKAAELSGRLNTTDLSLYLTPGCHLVISEFGILWLFIYSKNNQSVYFSLIHGDGSFISPSLASELVKDTELKKHTSGLKYLAPKMDPDDRSTQLAVKRKYLNYLAKVCGEIQLDGLPADQEVGSKKLKLESLFVPMRLIRTANKDIDATVQLEANSSPVAPLNDQVLEIVTPQDEPVPLGKVLAKENRIALLGLPGSGKSTLIKRLAIAYAFPARKAQIKDGLPDKKWLPIFLRCRQLGSLANSPILSILSDLSDRAEIEESHKEAFRNLLLEAVKSGKALLLIDGLDEISSESSRVSFVNQLRLFLTQYPAVSLILTSRNAGFRVIGSTLSSECSHFNLAPFSPADITKLTLAWHSIVVGNRKEVTDGATSLAMAITANFRLLKLAENPLLLTTLLLIKRWVTQLPTKRSALYGRAVEVLLMTWNVEGHLPLDVDEVIPQLAYVALQMMRDGVQRIAHDDLQRELHEARRSMPDILGYTKISVRDFIQGVELRSSLLLQSGHELRNGSIQPVYEFRHLLFQEYLAAKAAVESYLPNGENVDLLDVLRPHLKDDSWEEVIVLAASLAGRRSGPLMRELVTIAKSEPKRSTEILLDEDAMSTRSLLAQCLADEIPLASSDLDAALTELIPLYFTPSVQKSRYGAEFESVCSRELWSAANFSAMECGHHLGYIGSERLKQDCGPSMRPDELLLRVLGESGKKGSEALFTAAIYAYTEKHGNMRYGPSPDKVKRLIPFGTEAFLLAGDIVASRLDSEAEQDQVGASWALAWFGDTSLWTIERNPKTLTRLFKLWANTPNSDVQYLSSWAIGNLPLTDESLWAELDLRNDQKLARKVRTIFSKKRKAVDDRELVVALLYTTYLRCGVPDRKELVAQISKNHSQLKQFTTALIDFIAADFSSPDCPELPFEEA